MNPSNAYWAPPPFLQHKSTSFLKPLTHTTGFSLNIPFPDPVSGPHYYGENPVFGRREYGFNTLPELHPVMNIIPTTAGKARINLKSLAATYERKVLKV